MNILITGASGFIGQHLLKACLDRKHTVTACVRNGSLLQRYYPDIQLIQCDFTKDNRIDVWLPRLADIDVVINAVGIFQEHGCNTFDALHAQTPCALFKACEITGISKVVHISALGADDTAFSRYHLSKKVADDFLSTLEMNWIILMPSIVYGPGAKSLRLFKAMAALPITPLLQDGSQSIQPISVFDLTKAVLGLIGDRGIHHQRVEAVGPEPVTMLQLFTLLKFWLGFKHTRFLKIPYKLAFYITSISEYFIASPVNTDALKMLQHGNTGNVQQFAKVFGFMPASLKQVLLQNPPLVGDYLDTRQYFLLPLLRLTLAWLWIFTGFISVFGFPIESSYSMLARVGVTDYLAPFFLYSSAALDIGLGIALLFAHHLRIVVFVQIGIVLAYTLIISLGLPELWLHPFGPISKNIPLIIATMFLIAREK